MNKKNFYYKNFFRIKCKFFDSDILENKFKRFEEQDLIKISECGYCQKAACKFHTKFLVSCKFCRKTFFAKIATNSM